MPDLVASFSLLTPLLLLLLGSGQVYLWRMWPKHRGLWWMGSAFVSLSAGIALQLLWRTDVLLPKVLAFSVCYLYGFSCMSKALAFRMKVRFDRYVAIALSVLCLLLQIWFTVMEPNLSARVYVINLVTMAVIGLPLLYWRSMHVRNFFDHLLRWAFVLYILSSMVRLMVLLPQSQVLRAMDFTQTWFWLSVHVICMAFGMLGAAAMFFAVLRDVLDKLHTNSYVDTLTQALNRRGWEVHLKQLQQQEWQAATQPYALLLMDLDHFKDVNDHWGHVAGDQVLLQTVSLLKRQVRANDLVCRYGGEEFVVLLVGVTLEIAQQVAERIRAQMQATTWPMLQGQCVTMSIGVTALKSLDFQDVANAMQAADTQLYAAKHDGRNRVCVSSPP